MLNIVILLYSNTVHEMAHTLLNLNLHNLLLMPGEHTLLKRMSPQIILYSSTTAMLMRLEQLNTTFKRILD